MDIQSIDMLIIPVVVGMTEIFKQFVDDSRFYPVFSIVIAAITMVSVAGFSVENLIQGILFGLSACGLYSGTKATVGN